VRTRRGRAASLDADPAVLELEVDLTPPRIVRRTNGRDLLVDASDVVTRSGALRVEYATPIFTTVVDGAPSGRWSAKVSRRCDIDAPLDASTQAGMFASLSVDRNGTPGVAVQVALDPALALDVGTGGRHVAPRHRRLALRGSRRAGVRRAFFQAIFRAVLVCSPRPPFSSMALAVVRRNSR
jgi:hypothetical protein